MPALWFLGLIVAGTRLGLAIARRPASRRAATPTLRAFVGLLILQLLILLPLLGAVVVFFAGIWGAGALAVTAFRGAGIKGVRGRRLRPPRRGAAAWMTGMPPA